jgi:RND family efflux transporter MFP subunit
MLTRYIIPAIGLMGLAFAILFSNGYGRASTPAPSQLSEPPSTPYKETVSGTGIVEANTRNIEIGSFLSGIVTVMNVREGDAVKKGDVLFTLDDRAAQAALRAAEKEVKSAEARLTVAQSSFADEKDQLARVEKLKVGQSISEDRLQRRRFAAKRAQAGITQAQAEMESAKAMRDEAKVNLERLSVRSPIDGRVLKTNVNVGEFVTAGSVSPVLLGADRPLHLRVSIDENDVWRFTGDAPARASLRSNKEISFPLDFVRLEPYVQPKRNLNGDMSERVDTRVLEVVYSFDPEDKNVYIGQQMDVFVDAEKISK